MRYVKVALDQNFQVIPNECYCHEYQFLAETNKQVVYTPVDPNFSFLMLEKEQNEYNRTKDKTTISDYSEDKFWRKYYHYAISVWSGKSKEEVEKMLTKEFSKWINKKIAKYSVKTKIDIKITGDWS